MKGGISLKDFILGVKEELKEASTEGSKNPFLELTQVELEAEFGLDAKASGEGGFKFLVKIGGETTASQLHKVKLIFSPINDNVAFALAPTDYTSISSDSTPKPTIDITGHNPPSKPYVFHIPSVPVIGKSDIDEIVNEAILKFQQLQKDSSNSNDDNS